MSWVVGVLAVVALFGAFGFMNGALEEKRDCHKCPEEAQSPACDTCPLAGGTREATQRRGGLTLVRGNHGATHVS